MSGLPAYVAQLRVYEPLAAFTPPERERWRAYAAAGSAPAPERGPVLEREAGLRALLGLVPAWLPQIEEHAYVTEVDGVTLVCPWSTRARACQALTELAGTEGQALLSGVPEPVIERARQQLRARQDTPVHLWQSAWHVPVRWFVAVDGDERQMSPGRPAGASAAPASRRTGRSLVYRTAMSRARRRTARALEVLRRTLDDEVSEGVAVAGVEEMGRWLENFHPRSLVELDYGGLVHLYDDNALAADESAVDVATALTALSEGDEDAAAAAYERVVSRMAGLQAVESVS